MGKTRFFALALSALLLAGCGTGTSSSSSRNAAPVPTGPNVVVAWSVLENRKSSLPAVVSRWYSTYMDHLVPRCDYGSLVPFAGALAYTVVDTSGYPISLYGLMTLDGKIVMDAVCDTIFQPGYSDLDSTHTIVSHTLPVFQLQRGDPTHGDPSDGALIALAAQDGSWCTDFIYWGCFAYPGGIAAGDETCLSLLDAQTGAVTKSWTWAELGIEDPSRFPWFTGDAYDTAHWTGEQFFLGTEGDTCDTARFLNPETGEVTTKSAQEWYAFCDQFYQNSEWWDIALEEDGTVLLSRQGQSYSLPIPFDLKNYGPYVAGDTFVVFQDYESRFAVTLLDGTVILPTQEGSLTVLEDNDRNVLWLAVRPAGATDWLIYSRDGSLLSTLPASEESWCSLSWPLVEIRNETFAAYYQPATGTCVFRTYLALDG